MTKLIVILGDQLSRDLSALSDIDKDNDIILMCEVFDETNYVQHHKKKIAFLFSAMRHFSKGLEDDGYSVCYTKLTDPENTHSFTSEVARLTEAQQIKEIIITEPGEYRVLKEIKTWQEQLDIPVTLKTDTRFLCTIDAFKSWAKDKKSIRMEFFYREMRKKHNILMSGTDPEGGRWNFDKENRKPLKDNREIPAPYTGQVDDITQEVIDLVQDKFSAHFGDLEPFYFAVTRDQAIYALNKFINERLVDFGDYQDAMVQNEPWLYHSHLSFYINCGLLNPLEVIRKAEEAYYKGHAPLNAVEGFIRQILGWREYIRGVYWLKMPDYAESNHLNAKRALPDLFWTAHTKMNCMRQCVLETKENAYAHHIQRLMVLGNFALIAGLDPIHVNEWYLIVYADAYEWVEMPNVNGMILYADGGYLASKPYAASGAYINRMSDYCKSCSYSVTKKNGEKACPFNYLYWDFFMRNQDILKENHRLKRSYHTLSKMSDEKKHLIQSDSQRFFKALENGGCV